MSKLIKVKNPCVFQGDKYLNSNKFYFEGWYFKNISGEECICFIPGISINEGKRKAFIQIITNSNSYQIDYDINDFSFDNKPFSINIGKSYFSCNFVHIDINDNINDLVIYGDLKYGNSKNIGTSWLSPNIMGIFSYIPFMECNHAILKMKNKVSGFISLNDEKIEFLDGVGYIEKDYGKSFPKRYIWGEGNCFKNKNCSFMFSVADIPFKIFNFKGLICSLIVNNKEYRFTTYNFSKIKKLEIDNNKVSIILKKRKYVLEIECDNNNSLMLKAPVNGNMDKEILESVDSLIKVTLKNKNKVIFSDISNNCGLEIVNE